MIEQLNIFPTKWSKQLPTGWQESADSMSNDELKNTIYDSEANVYVIEKSKEEDIKLQQAKEEIKEMQAPYSEAKKAQQAKIKYALFLLEGRGVDLDKSDK